MGKEVDQRVVEMRFDNKQFEENAKTSMSTLDKLKKSLRLDGATKGLENVDAAAKKVDMKGLSGAVETVRVKFSALEVIGVTALANITNSAINAGKQMVKSLSMDQITAGYSKYEQETSNVQTLMNSTGKSVDEINGYLEKLMWFSDETSYGFTDMTAALSSMVSSGGDIEKLIPMIEGMATATAYAGKGAAEFSRVIYNLNQSYGQGYLGLMDWKSVENAGASSKQLKELIIDTAKELGTLNKAGETLEKGTAVTAATFAQTLNEKWATSEVMEKAFTKFSAYAVAVQEAVSSGAYESTADAMKGLAGQYDQLAVKAFEASQKAKTFTEAVDATKDAASSEWKKIWKSILGDYEQAAETWTDISGDLWDIFVGPLEGITETVNGAMSSSWDKIKKQVTDAGVPIEDFKMKLVELGKKNGVVTDEMIEQAGSFEKSLKSGWLSGKLISEALKDYTGSATIASKATQNFESIVKRVINGEFGNGAARVKALTEAGYDYATVQDLVNKTVWGQKVNYEQLSDAQLKNIGFTEDQIAAIRALAEEAEKTGTPLNELIASMEKPSGRELIIDTIRNALNGLKGVVYAVQEAFTGLSSTGLYSFLEKLNEMSKKLILVDNETGELNEKGQKLAKTFKGFASVLRMINNFIKGSFKLALKLLSTLFGNYNKSVLDVTASIGDSIVKFEEWINSNNTLAKIIKAVTDALVAIVTKIREAIIWVKNLLVELYKLPAVQNAVNNLKTACVNFAKDAGKWFVNLGDKIGGLLGKFKNLVSGVTKEKINLKKVDLGEALTGSSGVKGIEAVNLAISNVGESVKTLGLNAENDLANTSNVFASFANKVKSIFSGLTKWLSTNVGFGEIFTVALGAGVVIAIKKVFDLLSLLKKPLQSVDDLLVGVTNGITGLFDALIKDKNADAFKKRAEGMLDFAKSVGILVIALFALTKMDYGKLDKAAKTLGVIVGVMTAIWLVMTLLSKLNVGIFSGTGGTAQMPITNLIASLATIITALKSMENMDYKKTKQNAKILAAMLGALAVIGIALANLAPQLSKGATLFIGIGIAIKLLVSSLKTLNDMDLKRTMTSLAILKSLVVNIIAILLISNAQTGKAGAGILAIAASLLLVIIAIKAIARMDDETLVKGLMGIIAIVYLFIGLMGASQLAGQYADKGGKAIIAMSASLLLVSIAIKILAGIDGGDLAKATVAVSAIMLIMSGCITLMTRLGGDSSKLRNAGVTMILMSAALVLVAAVVVVLSHIEGGPLAKAIVALAGIEILFMGLIAVTKYANDCKGTIIALTVTIAVLATALGLLSMIPPEKVAVASASLSAVIGMFALLMFVTKYAKIGKDVMASVGVMITVVVALAAIVYQLSELGVDSAIGAAASISILLLSLSASMLALQFVGKMSWGAIAQIAVLTALVAGIGAMLWVFQDVLVLDPESCVPIAISLSTLLLALSAACIVLGVAGSLGPAAFIGIGVLAALIAAIGAIVIGLGALMDKFPKLEEFLDKGIPILEKIGYALGSFAGNIIKGFASAVLDIIPMIGTKLSLFWENIQPFLNGVQNIPKSALTGAADLAKIMILMAAGEIVSSIASFMSFLTGGSSLIKFGMELAAFAPFVVSFAKKMGELSGEELIALEMSSQAVKYLCEAANAVPKRGGLLSKITGENSLTDFAKELEKFGPELIAYAGQMLEFTDNHKKAIKRSCEGVAAICEVASKVPKHGGLVQMITGDNSLTDFAVELNNMAPALMSYANTMLGFTKKHVSAVQTSCGSIEEICKVAEKVPKHGGFVQAITGDNSLKAFAEELKAMAPALVEYANTMADEMGADQYQAITDSFIAIENMASIASKIPKTDGLKDIWSGFGSLDSFTGKLETVGTNLSNYAKSLIDNMPKGGWDTISKSIPLISKFVEQANNIPENKKGSTTLGDFGGYIKTLGMAYGEYCKSIKNLDMDKMETSISKLRKLFNLAKDMSGVNMANFNSFGKALENVAKAGIDKFIKAFNDSDTKAENEAKDFVNRAKKGAESKKTALKNAFEDIVKAAIKPLTGDNTTKSKFRDAGKAAVEQLVAGMNDKKQSATDGCSTIASTCVTALRNKYNDFVSAGKYVVTGFVNGINNSTKTLSKASIKLANTTRDAIKKALDINSPSRVMYGLGKYTGQGFINALLDYCDVAGKAGYDMAESAKDGLNNAISTIQDFIDGKISNQPTIRPVLDLSDIESGARQINGMFSARQAVALASSGTIGIQNGGSGYVINMTINGAQGQDVNQLADLVSERINNSIQRRNNVWR